MYLNFERDKKNPFFVLRMQEKNHVQQVLSWLVNMTMPVSIITNSQAWYTFLLCVRLKYSFHAINCSGIYVKVI